MLVIADFGSSNAPLGSCGVKMLLLRYQDTTHVLMCLKKLKRIKLLASIIMFPLTTKLNFIKKRV